MTLLETIEVMQKNNKNFNQFFNIAHSDMLNNGKFSHQGEANTFQQMFINEVAGMIDVYKEDLADIMEFIYSMEAKEAQITFSEQEVKQYRDKTVKSIQNIITNVFHLNKAGKKMPTIHILSSLYAAVRWDKNQKFQDNDFYDFRHATAALPYCDYFFTEKRLSHLLVQNLLKLDKFYGCNIQSTLEGAISCLQKLETN